MTESVRARVPHNDYTGSVAADGAVDGAPLREFAERHGVDVAAWEPIGVCLSTGEHGYHKVNLMAVDRRRADRVEAPPRS